MFFKTNLAKKRKEKLEESRLDLERAELVIEEWTAHREMLKGRVARLVDAVAADNAEIAEIERKRQAARRPHVMGMGQVPPFRPATPPGQVTDEITN